MKLLTTALLASLTLAATAFAGHEVIQSSGKDKVQVATTCFNDKELQVDLFGAYSVGEGPSHAGPIHDHGFGGGIGVNYFFSRHIGIGAEGMWLSSRHNEGQPGTSNETTTFHNVNGSLIFRFPIDRLCVAPYVYVGGGAVMDGDKWAVAFGGAGVEYRVIPNKLGLFVDERWNYYGDRFGRDEQNNFTSRAGVRWIF